MLDHHAGAGAGGIWMLDRVVGGGRLEHSCEDGRFGNIHIARGFAEVFLCRLLNAGGAGTIINAIEIKLQDIVLGVFGLEPDGQDELLQFALHGSLRLEKEIFRKLLSDGRAALDNAAGAKIAERSRSEERRVGKECRSRWWQE